MSTHRLVVVDDDDQIRDTLSEYLQLHGYEVLEAADGKALRALIDGGEQLDLAVLDITMPGEDGLSLARFLREHTDMAIVMATAAGETVDRIVGLEMGADDYLAKPVDLRELLARVKAVLRRRDATPRSGTASATGDDELRLGRYTLNVAKRTLVDAKGDAVSLTSMEFDLLKAFAENPDRVLSRDQLLDLAHHKRWDPFDRSIDLRVGRIRKKLEREPNKPTLIKTVHGVGYVYASTDC